MLARRASTEAATREHSAKAGFTREGTRRKDRRRSVGPRLSRGSAPSLAHTLAWDHPRWIQPRGRLSRKARRKEKHPEGRPTSRTHAQTEASSQGAGRKVRASVARSDEALPSPADPGGSRSRRGPPRATAPHGTSEHGQAPRKAHKRKRRPTGGPPGEPWSERERSQRSHRLPNARPDSRSVQQHPANVVAAGSPHGRTQGRVPPVDALGAPSRRGRLRRLQEQYDRALSNEAGRRIEATSEAFEVLNGASDRLQKHTRKGQRAGPKESRWTRPRPGSVEPRPVECP